MSAWKTGFIFRDGRFLKQKLIFIHFPRKYIFVKIIICKVFELFVLKIFALKITELGVP